MLKILKNKIITADAKSNFSAEEEARVRQIIETVAKEGDQALIKYTAKYDGVSISRQQIKVSKGEIDEAYEKVKPGFIKALSKAIVNISEYHRKQKPDEFFETQSDDVVLGLRAIPIESAGIYVPGGSAAYPTSVLMNAIPARIAGVRRIAMVTPPMKENNKIKANPYSLVAAAELGIHEIYKIGGAQSIAALTFGTETIAPVDKIVGPGNKYVTLAKKIVFGDVGIDKLAGPSDVVILADQDAEPPFIAADILSQAEHDPDSSAVLITNSKKLAEQVNLEIKKQMAKLKRKETIKKALDNSYIVVVDSLDSGIDMINQLAPEHLEIIISSPHRMLEKVKNAGAVFLGPYSPVAAGDYLAGPNHVLPTNRSARFASPLTVYDFIKHQSILGYTKPALMKTWKDIKLLAEIEGLDAHARSVEIRFK
jgi:histidinol dehydrogenase